jgi:hypothetical protein
VVVVRDGNELIAGTVDFNTSVVSVNGQRGISAVTGSIVGVIRPTMLTTEVTAQATKFGVGIHD